ncbi:MAG: excinuclease ABC subunit UvrA [Candidatus Omnitrophota bacterium]
MNAFSIQIRGARENNLKNISLEIPRNRFVVITGLSGSGKSSLAFDTIYAEGQRRYLESLSSYARQFLEKMKKPEVDSITGLSPTLAIRQGAASHNPRSTLATVTEIYDYLRLLFAKAGVPEADARGGMVPRPAEEILDEVLEKFRGKELQVFAPLVRGRKGEFREMFETLLKKGFARARIDGRIVRLEPKLKLRKHQRHDIELLIDHLKISPGSSEEIKRAIGQAAEQGEGRVAFGEPGGEGTGLLFYAVREFREGGKLRSQLAPNLFSFNSPYGACPRCKGLGVLPQISVRRVIKDPSRPLMSGGLNEELFFSFNKYFIEDLLYEITQKFHLEWNAPFSAWPEEAREAFFWGGEDVDGLIEELQRFFHETSSEEMRRKIRKFLSEDLCSECGGKRLKKESLSVRIAGKNIVEVTAMTVTGAAAFFETLGFPERDRKITTPLLREIRERLGFLLEIGLGYLTLDRSVASLAGGEIQRIRLAAQIGTGLTGVLYVLDEPSIGLHPRDNGKLLDALLRLRDMKNTVLVVEHDEETMRRADHLIDLGPGAGRVGGEVVAFGEPGDFMRQTERSRTAQFLSGREFIAVPAERKRPDPRRMLRLTGCREHNLKGLEVTIPLGLFVCVTGVSGSGKSTLVHDTLYKELHNRIWRTNYRVGKFQALRGAEAVKKVIEIDQAPIGRTPRSIPATYVDLFGPIRRLFSELRESKLRNYSAARFSFNLKGGRCEHCRGEGEQKLEMSFLPDVHVPCEHCRGKRYNDATLEVRYRGKTIVEVLDLSVEEALEFFEGRPLICEKLDLMNRIGLGYLKLGQSSTTLSGGEAQRVKLAAELSRRAGEHTLYLLDEPTTGLHFADVDHLMKALFQLRDQGHTVLVIEHHLDVVKCADHVIDLGPEGGNEGGELVCAGTPEAVARCSASYTGRFLAKILPNCKEKQ